MKQVSTQICHIIPLLYKLISGFSLSHSNLNPNYIIQEFINYGQHIKLLQLYKLIDYQDWKAMKVKSLENNIKLQQIQSRLNKFAFLSKESLPNWADAEVFLKLKAAQRIPSKDLYENFYHWYITVSQFAKREIQSWKNRGQELEGDRTIIECLTLLQTIKESQMDLKSPISAPIDYIMNIFVKEPLEDNITKIKNKLLMIDSRQIGEELEVSFKSYQERLLDSQKIPNQIRIMFKLKPSSCDKFQQLVFKWGQVENIQVRKQMKEKGRSMNNN